MIHCLQAGRALAAIAVVCFHAVLAADSFAGARDASAPFFLGRLGVDFLFVLSGFIIYTSTAGSAKTARTYFTSRFRRIFIPYLPVSVGLAVLYSLFPRVSFADRNWSWIATLTLWPDGIPALNVAWSLQHEILFYVLFGLSYFSGRLFLGLSIWLCAIVIGVTLGASGMIPLRIINIEFMFGIAAAIMAQRNLWHVAMPPAAIACFTLWAALGCLPALSPIVGLGFALLLPPIVAAERSGRIRAPGWLIFLGGASYSIYLAHGLAISIVSRTVVGYWPILISSIVAGIAAGLVYGLAVENPLIQWTRVRSKPTRATPPARARISAS